MNPGCGPLAERHTGSSHTLKRLEEFFKSSTLDLVKKWGARKVDSYYEVPITKVPWISVKEVEVSLKPGFDVRFRVPELSSAPGYELYAFLLVGDTGYGVSFGARRRLGICRIRKFAVPLGLTLPNYIKVEPIMLRLSDGERLDGRCIDREAVSRYLVVTVSHLDLVHFLDEVVDLVEILE